MSRTHEAGRALVLGALLAASGAQAGEARDVCGKRPKCSGEGTTAALKGHEVVELSLGKRAPEEGPEREQREWWLRRPDQSVVKRCPQSPGGRGGFALFTPGARCAPAFTPHIRCRYRSTATPPP